MGSANTKSASGHADADYVHAMDVEEFRRHAHEMVDFICDYNKRVEEQAVLPTVEPGYLRELLPAEAPEQPQPFADVMHDVRDKIMPGMTHWQSPNFFAYFPGNSSYPGILGELLSAALNIIGFSWRGCPAATDLEKVVLNWFGKLLRLPEAFLAYPPGGGVGTGGAVIQGSASDAVVVTLLAAKARVLEGRPPGDAARLALYFSDQAHSCAEKACVVTGVIHWRALPTTGEDEWAMQPGVLEAAIEKDLAAGLIPFYVCATVGTTSSCAVDPLRGLGEITRKHGVWLHVDAAYAGVTAMLPEMAPQFEGLELADSFDTNPHKWLLTNFDVSTLYVADVAYLKQALTLNKAFILNKYNEYDFKDWQIPFGRRFRALKLWFVLRTYGAEGLRGYLRHHISMAKDFAALVESDPRFRLAATQRFSLTCFVLKDGSREQNAALLDAVNATGKVFLTHTELGGEYVLRMAIGAAATQPRHVRACWALLCEKADEILASLPSK